MVERTETMSGAARTRGVALWLLLLSIFTHALVPAGSPLQRTSGSAFSASTVEVSLAPSRKSLEAQQAAQAAGDEEGGTGAASADADGVPAPSPSLARPSFEAAARPAPEPAFLSESGGAASFQARAPPAA